MPPLYWALIALGVTTTLVLVIELTFHMTHTLKTGPITIENTVQSGTTYQITVSYKRSWLARLLRVKAKTETFVGEGTAWYSTSTNRRVSPDIYAELHEYYRIMRQHDICLVNSGDISC